MEEEGNGVGTEKVEGGGLGEEKGGENSGQDVK